MVSVIIAAYDEEVVLGATLDALLADAPDAEVIVVANGCHDDTAGVARRRPGVRVDRAPRRRKTSSAQRGRRGGHVLPADLPRCRHPGSPGCGPRPRAGAGATGRPGGSPRHGVSTSGAVRGSYVLTRGCTNVCRCSATDSSAAADRALRDRPVAVRDRFPRWWRTTSSWTRCSAPRRGSSWTTSSSPSSLAADDRASSCTGSSASGADRRPCAGSDVASTRTRRPASRTSGPGCATSSPATRGWCLPGIAYATLTVSAALLARRPPADSARVGSGGVGRHRGRALGLLGVQYDTANLGLAALAYSMRPSSTTVADEDVEIVVFSINSDESIDTCALAGHVTRPFAPSRSGTGARAHDCAIDA